MESCQEFVIFYGTEWLQSQGFARKSDQESDLEFIHSFNIAMITASQQDSNRSGFQHFR